jgi:hypothetical protein
MSVETRTKAILLTAVVIALLLATIIGIVYFRRISSTGTIKTVGCDVFADSALTQRVTEINWGMCEPGKEYNKSVYIKNTSNVPVNLTLGTENWNPATASDYITLYWNYKNQTLAVNEMLPVTFTLAIASNITGITSFNFDITVITYG